MAEDTGNSFLGGIKDVVNAAPVIGAWTRTFWGKGNFDPAAVNKPLTPLTPESLVAGLVPTRTLGSAYDAATSVPLIGEPLKFALDLPNRTFDSAWSGAQESDRLAFFGGEDDLTDRLGNFAQGWRRSWDNWGTESHVSGGQIVAGHINDGAATAAADLGTQQGVDRINEISKRTWYGNVAGGVLDLTAGFVGPETAIAPLVRGARAGRVLSTLDDVENAADVFNRASVAGKVDDLKVGRGQSFFRGLTATPQSGETYAARLRDMARDAVAHSGNMVDSMNYFGPRMANATEGAKRIMAETAVYANTLGGDAATHLTTNTWLALMGSTKAADEVIKTAPLVMAKITNATAAPADLAVTAAGMEKLYQAHVDGNFEGIPKIMDEIFETPAKQAEFNALRAEWERATEDAVRARELRTRVRASKPQQRIKGNDGKFIDNFDTARLKEARINADTAFRSLSEELRQAKLEAKGNTRWADAGNKAGKKGDIGSTADFNQGKGAADQRVTTLEQQLAEAKADRDLLNSTPLNDPAEFERWRRSMNASKLSSGQAKRKADFLKAMERSSGAAMRADAAAARRISPQLNSANLWLADIMSAKEGVETLVGQAGDTMLQRMKTRYRDRVGQTFLFDTGEYTPRVFFHKMPKDFTASIGTAYGRRAVNTNDLYKGSQELPMFLKKSGAFDGDEIRQFTEDYLSASPKTRAEVVARARDEMVSRMLLDAGFDPRQIGEHIRLMNQGMAGYRSYLTGRLSKAEASGDMWVKTNSLPDMDGGTQIDMFDTPFLRSHLADSVPFADPADVKRYIHLHKKNQALGRGTDIAVGAVDMFNYWWKVAQLARPGLFFRNMIDTGIRAQMLMGTMAVASSAATGSLHKVRDLGVRVGDWAHHSTKGTSVERIGARLGPDTLAKHYLGDKGVPVDIGGGKTAQFNLYDLSDGHASAASVAAIQGAATKGASMGEGIMGSGMPLYDRLIKEHAKWDKFKANAPDVQWVHAYRDHAEALLASPTARKLIELEVKRFDPMLGDPADLVDDLFRDPKVRDEYTRLAAEEGMSREAWVDQILWEMDNMFPEAGMAEAVLSGRLRGRTADDWVKEHFPVEARFDLPGRESRLGEGASARARTREAIDASLNTFFENIIDKPDFWLIRHPVMVKTYANQVKAEASRLLASRQAKFGDDFVLTEKDLATIDRRSRAHAIGQVKEFMYDNTYTNGVGWLHRVAPFFNPWYDAMRSYSKLITDDPQRMRNLFGLWNAPTNVSQWLAEPLVVDQNGNPLKPGQEPEEGGRFFVINSLIGKSNKGGGGVKLRQDSFNTLLMGEVPWLPGWGPTIQVPAAIAINSDEDVALWLADNKNPMVHKLMQSLWPEGQVPASDWESLKNSITPATWKKVANWATGGQAYWTNVQHSLNAQYMRAVQNGEVFDPAKAQIEAEKQAQSAAWWSVVSQGIFGISAESDVDGEFYAARMREYFAMDPEVLKAEGYPSPQAKFIEEFPEAESLIWSFTRNETGIQATVKAQSKANGLRPLIEKTPDMGWFIVGEENVGGDFSQTAYNQQKSIGYGITDKGRKVLAPGEVMENTLVGVGWNQYTAVAQTIDQMGKSYGFSREVLAAVRRYYAQQIGTQNPQWFADFNDRDTRRDVFFLNADNLAKDPRMKGRQDIGMYLEYRGARQQILDHFGLKALSGTGVNSRAAKAALYTIGTQMAERNIGFQQMWERMLLSEVEPEEGEIVVNAA